MSAEAKESARARALRTARVVTLGLAVAGTPGCEAAMNAYCDVFSGSRACCERDSWHTWDETTHSCVAPVVPGPIVAPG